MADIKLNCCTSEAARSFECSSGDQPRSPGESRESRGAHQFQSAQEAAQQHISQQPTQRDWCFIASSALGNSKARGREERASPTPSAGAARSVPGPDPHQTTPECPWHELQEEVLCKITRQQVGITSAESLPPTVSPKGSKATASNENRG